MKKLLLFIPLFVFVLGCRPVMMMKSGYTDNKDFYEEIPFEYIDGLIIIPVKIENKEYKFIFDTGAEVCLLDSTVFFNLDYTKIKKIKMFSTHSSKLIPIAKLKQINIEGVPFNDAYFATQDMKHIFDRISCVQVNGIIGNNVMRKANWQIDYQTKTIKISNKIEQFNISENAFQLKMNTLKYGNVKLDLKIKDETEKYTFDTGYSGFIMSSNNNNLNKVYITAKNYYSVNLHGININEVYFDFIDSLNINNIPFLGSKYIKVDSNGTNLIGNEFFYDYIITIDWNNDILSLEPQTDIIHKYVDLFELLFYTNYDTKSIHVKAFLSDKFLNEIAPNTQILKINDIDISQFSCNELFKFCNVDFEEIKKSDAFKITIESNGKPKEYTINKIKL